MAFTNIILQKTHQKVYQLPQLLQQNEQWQKARQKVVFTNGCFDIIHRGHLHTLSQARSKGDVLVVGLNADISVRLLKGDSRPVQDEVARGLILASFWFVDAVVLFNTPTPLQLIEALKPQVLVKGGDYTLSQIVGASCVLKNGGEVLTVPYLPGHSTTNILSK